MSDQNPEEYWKKCSSCRKLIGFSTDYYLCNISTCRAKRTGKQFCSVSCWDAHLGYVTHRNKTYAEKHRSPKHEEPLKKEPVETPKNKRIIIDNIKPNNSSLLNSSESTTSNQANSIDTDILVVVSKIKKLISEQSDMNTSKCCVERLTKKVIEECLKGIKNAEKADRKTVMGRDIV